MNNTERKDTYPDASRIASRRHRRTVACFGVVVVVLWGVNLLVPSPACLRLQWSGDSAGANYSNCSCEQTVIVNRRLTGINLINTTLEFPTLAAVTMNHGRLTRSFWLLGQLYGCDLSGSDARGARFTNIHFYTCDLRGADLSDAKFEGCCFFACDLRGTKLSAQSLVGCWYDKCTQWPGEVLSGGHEPAHAEPHIWRNCENQQRLAMG